MVKETGCQAVKLEGGGGASVERARAIVRAGIPVMGHVGLTPQTATALGGYKAQGRTAERGRASSARTRSRCRRSAASRSSSRRSRRAVTEAIMPKLEIPVIGIGAGPATDGQVLVFHDLLGIPNGHGPKFVKRYASLHDEMVAGVAAFADEVRDRHFPEPEHVYSIEADELDAFRAELASGAARADRQHPRMRARAGRGAAGRAGTDTGAPRRCASGAPIPSRSPGRGPRAARACDRT